MGNLFTPKSILATLKSEMNNIKKGNRKAFLSKVISIFAVVEAFFASIPFPFLESILYIAILCLFCKRM